LVKCPEGSAHSCLRQLMQRVTATAIKQRLMQTSASASS